MARVTLVDPATATGELAETFSEIESHAGKVGNIWRALANNPKMLKAVWDRRNSVMGSDSLPHITKEAIALAVSSANNCEYCVVAHSASMSRLGESTERIDDILALQGKDEAEQALIDVCVRAVTDPHALEDKDFDRLRDLGHSDAAIFDAIGVATHYAAINKFLDSFQVDLD